VDCGHLTGKSPGCLFLGREKRKASSQNAVFARSGPISCYLLLIYGNAGNQPVGASAGEVGVGGLGMFDGGSLLLWPENVVQAEVCIAS